MAGSIGPSHFPRPPEPHKTRNPEYRKWERDREHYVINLTDEYMRLNRARPNQEQITMWREQFEQDHPKPPRYLLG